MRGLLVRGSNAVATAPRLLDGIGLLAADFRNPVGTVPGMHALHPDQVATAIRDAAERIASTEAALPDARAALATAEAALAVLPTPGTAPAALTTTDDDDALRLSRSTVAEMLRRGEIRSVKIGGSRRAIPDLHAR
jgi:hypothetical protein